jgi:hypothetical protein
MMTFSFRPTSGSDADSSAASVSTRVVSWKEAADSHESVASDALVIPISIGRPRRLAAFGQDAVVLLVEPHPVDVVAGQEAVSPASTTFTRRNICRTISSTCLSWIGTPCER